MTLAERIAAAEAQAKAAEGAVESHEFVAEAEARERYEKARARAHVAYTKLRDAVAARMLDEHEPDTAAAVKFDSPAANIFVVKAAGGKEFRDWQNGIRDAAVKKQVKGGREKVNTDDVNRRYTVAGIVGWATGAKGTDGSWTWTQHDLDDSEQGAALNRLLSEQPAIMTRLQDTISGFDGAAAEEAKS